MGKVSFLKGPKSLVKGSRDLVITEDAFEEAMGTHGGAWPFDSNTDKSP